MAGKPNYISLTRGKIALVDEEDWEWLSKRGWCALRQVRNGVEYWYAIASTKKPKPYMHRLIVKAKPGQLVDHKNGNTLDNRKENLRIATRSQNAMNRRQTKDRKLPKGVFVSKGRIQAKIMVNRKGIYLGTFTSVGLAAAAYDEAAKKYFGEFARTNG